MANDPQSAGTSREEISIRIRELRKRQGKTLKDIGEAIDVSLAHLSQVERGESAISGEKLARLAEALGVTTDFLLTGVGQAEDRFPPALVDLAEELQLSFANTRRLLYGKNSLVARRSSSSEDEWDKEKWRAFYKKVKDFL